MLSANYFGFDKGYPPPPNVLHFYERKAKAVSFKITFEVINGEQDDREECIEGLECVGTRDADREDCYNVILKVVDN